MSNIIAYDEKLDLCPNCMTPLNVKKVMQSGFTTCSECNYLEAAGSSVYTTYYGALLQDIVENEFQISELKIGTEDIIFSFLFNPRGLLYLLLSRTTALKKELLLDRTNVINSIFTLVADKGAINNARVVILPEINITHDEIVAAMVNELAVNRYQVKELIVDCKNDNTFENDSSIRLELLRGHKELIEESFTECFENTTSAKTAKTANNDSDMTP